MESNADAIEEELEERERRDGLLKEAIGAFQSLRRLVVIGLACAFVCIAATGFAVWTIHDDNTSDEYRDCLDRQEARGGIRLGIIEGAVRSARTLIVVAGSDGDPRAEKLITQTRADMTELVDELLAPVEC